MIQTRLLDSGYLMNVTFESPDATDGAETDGTQPMTIALTMKLLLKMRRTMKM
jgi:hypothetical protein